MDSGSDWDSLTGDDEFTLSYKQSMPNDKDDGNGRQKSPVTSTAKKDNDVKKTSTRKNQSSDDIGHTKQNSTTVFVDREYNYTPKKEDVFESIDLEDKSLENKYDREEERNKKKQATLGVNEKLPYTNFRVSSADKNKQKEDKNHLKVPNQHQKRKVKYEPKKSFDESSSWDMEAIEEGVIRNNNIVHYDPPVTKDHPQKTEKNAIMWKSDYEKVEMKNVTANTNASASVDRLPSVLSLYNVKEKQSISDDTIEQRYYYEKFYCNAHIVQIEDKSVIPKFADRLEPHIRRGWQEFFGLFRIIFDFITIFVIELLRLIFSTVFQKFIVGVITIMGDYFLKPLLSSVFNSVLQPEFVFLWNTTRGIRRLSQPLVQLFGDILQYFSGLLRSFRLFEYNNYRRGEVKTV